RPTTFGYNEMVHLHIMAGMCDNIREYFPKKVDRSKCSCEMATKIYTKPNVYSEMNKWYIAAF
ncbi:hypothetical protein J6590_025877, partial [Homalodisca vitripennis]